MGTNGYQVRGRSFRTASDYQAALRDERKIQAVLKKLENADMEGWEQIYQSLHRGTVTFETLLGDDFKDEIETQYKTKMQEFSKGRGRRIRKVNQKTKASAAARKKSASKAAAKSLDDFDEDMQKKIRYEMYLQERKRKQMVVICSLLAVFCIGYVIFYYALYEKNDAEYEVLAAMVEEGEKKPDNFRINYTREEEKELTVLSKYENLYNKNKSLIGWLKIDDTIIDYPVMQTANNEYYLDHNYDQEYDKNGSIFLDMDCDITDPGTNMIIYGHHMKSGKMFGDLDLYSSREYYEKHRYIQFDTIYEEGLYEVVFVFRSRIYNENDFVFKYYQFFDAYTEPEFDSAMKSMAGISLYDTGVPVSFGDQFITLSTCDDSEEDGRFVVVAKKIS